jgi:hypothetical protein
MRLCNDRPPNNWTKLTKPARLRMKEGFAACPVFGRLVLERAGHGDDGGFDGGTAG